MPGITPSKVADALTYALALGFAAACIVFAGYKMVVLMSMENPPPDMGLNFPPSKRKVITDDAILVDPLSTSSTAALGSASGARRRGRILQPYTSDSPIQDYKLLTVIDGVAFVEVLTLRGKSILPISEGTMLPGAGRVERIERVDGRWLLVAGDVNLTAERR